MNIETMLHQYRETALWSSIGDNDEPLDNDYNISDFSECAMNAMRNDCAEFISQVEPLIDDYPGDDEQLGHDFWLTRCGHGAGFWDRGLGELGDKLTAISKDFGDCYIYAGDDGLIYVAGEEK